jgi:hypothetical protein
MPRPPTFATFHVDTGGSGETDYWELVELLFASAERTHPGCSLALLTDERTRVPAALARCAVSRHPIDPARLMLGRLEAQLRFVESAGAGDLALLDSDMLVNGNLAPVFARDFDLALTHRDDPEMPLNGGLILIRAGGAAGAASFLRAMLACYCERHAAHAAWWGDQLAMIDVLGRASYAERRSDTVVAGSCRILLLPCDTYNFSPPEDPLSITYPWDGKVVLHFKGQRKAFMPRYWRRAVIGQAQRRAPRRSVLWYGDLASAGDRACASALADTLAADGIGLEAIAQPSALDLRPPPLAAVFTAPFTARAVAQARAAECLRVPVVVRLDHDPFPDPAVPGAGSPGEAAALRAIAQSSAAVVAVSPALAAVVRAERWGIEVVEIPDPASAAGSALAKEPRLRRAANPMRALLQSLPLRAAAGLGRIAYLSARAWERAACLTLATILPRDHPTRLLAESLLPRRPARVKPFARTLRGPIALWFGEAGVPGLLGITDLLLMADLLAAAARKHGLSLMVACDDADAYRRFIVPLAIESQLVPLRELPDALAAADLVLLPRAENRYARAESSARATAALARGIPVLATATPALEPLREFIHVDGWADLLGDPMAARASVARAGEFVAREYGDAAIGRQWAELIGRVARP